MITNSFDSPEQNIAFDEALLDFYEPQASSEAIRFWEAQSPFVVLGYSNKLKKEAAEERCLQDNIPILRRCSGGGTILQGPGCLNYTLILDITSRNLKNISKTNTEVMQTTAAALTSLTSLKVTVCGDTDLAIDDKKFSGNAQRRRLNKLLFHGTLLYHYDLSLISKYLQNPEKQPLYRERRDHKNFLRNLPDVSKSDLIETLSKAWAVTRSTKLDLQKETDTLIQEKYSRKEWNYKF